MVKGMWFGNRNYMQWILPPQINYESPRKSKIITAQYMNGGAFARRSGAGAREYNFSWTMKRRDEIRAIMDYFDGVYGNRDQLYFLDPFAMDKNVLPQWWATPALAAHDAPPLASAPLGTRPSLIATPANALRYPTFSAQYSLSTFTTVKPPLYIPIPPDHNLWVGAHGTATDTARVNIIPATGPTTFGSATALTLLSPSTLTRVNYSISGNNYPGAFLQLAGSGTLTLHGLIAQVLPWNVTPEEGPFISGQGHSGVSFSDTPILTQNNVALDRVSLSVALIETGGWL